MGRRHSNHPRIIHLREPARKRVLRATMVIPETLTGNSRWVTRPVATTMARIGVSGTTMPRTLNPTLVRTPSPYSDIPSLYDMYQQGYPRDPHLQRFAVAVFRENARSNRNSESLPMDLPVGPDYVLGPGDGVTINLWGSASRRLFRTVDSEGRLTLPEAGPILVSGRTLGPGPGGRSARSSNAIPRCVRRCLTHPLAHRSGLRRGRRPASRCLRHKLALDSA